MASMKSLAKDTAIYGLSSIVGRFLNYLLVPLYTHVISAATGGYGIVTNLYAYVALILVLLTFGMETTFFRFANKDDENPHCVFSTSMAVIVALTALFLGALFLFIDPISTALGYSDHKDYVMIMACVVSLDAIQAIPFSYLRYKKRPIKFAALKLLFIMMNIGLNLLYFVWLEKTDVFYIFFLNLVCTGFITFFFIPEFAHEHVAARAYCKERGMDFKIVDFSLLRRMLIYSWPILVLGVAGILNQTVDKMIFPLVYPDVAEGQVQLGIYGACVKIAMIMAMITQAFRYAYEPIVFAKSKDGDKKVYYAQAMKYFVIFTLFAYLCVVGWMPLLQRIIGEEYRDGLQVVPIVMAAEIMMGVYFNLSFWYKLIDKTIWGAWFSLAGCAVLIAVNVIFIPRYSYMACAWGGVAGYGTSMLLSYVVGQRKYPIRYDVKAMLSYLLVTVAFYYAMCFVIDSDLHEVLVLAANTVLILAYLAMVVMKEKIKIRR
ncbi:MAG: lipopolysaccharide biosynthesis protein [Prevotella sp.]|nr:lipopolysaccharide biosynthesis protein [Prevotella sp.]